MNQHVSHREASNTILLVEADSAWRQVLSQTLTGAGFDVRASDSPSLYRMLKDQGALACVVGEIAQHLGEGDIIGFIRACRHGKQVPIVESIPCSAPASGHAGASAHLLRPFQARQVLALIRLLHSGPTRDEIDGAEVSVSLPPPEALSVPRQGDLAVTPMSVLLVDIWSKAASGALVLKAATAIRRIDFVNGFPVSARSNQVTEHILRYLLRFNIITPEIYRDLLPRAQKPDFDPYSALVASSILPRATFLQVRRNLMEEIILQCLRWVDAAYRFRDDVPCEPHLVHTDLNPFALYTRWLSEDRIEENSSVRLAHILSNGLLASPEVDHVRHLVGGLAQLSAPAQEFNGSLSAASMIRGLPDEEKLRSLLLCLLDFRLLSSVPLKTQDSHGQDTALIPEISKKFERIRQIVADDMARVHSARTPFGVLGLADGASQAEVVARYQRFGRFYRPENFLKIGDDGLVLAAGTLRNAFRLAATDILGEVPEEVQAADLPPTQAHERRSHEGGQVLAEVFFDDGNTYLKIGDFKEAQDHFRRCIDLAGDNPRYLTQLGWVTYQAGKGNLLEVAKARQAFLNGLKLDANNDRALYYLGVLHEEERQLDRAIECWNKAVKLNPANFDAQSALRRLKDRT